MSEDLDVHDNTDKPQDGGTVLVDQEVFSGEGECKSGDGSSSENDPLALDDTAVSFLNSEGGGMQMCGYQTKWQRECMTQSHGLIVVS